MVMILSGRTYYRKLLISIIQKTIARDVVVSSVSAYKLTKSTLTKTNSYNQTTSLGDIEGSRVGVQYKDLHLEKQAT